MARSRVISQKRLGVPRAGPSGSGILDQPQQSARKASAMNVIPTFRRSDIRLPPLTPQSGKRYARWYKMASTSLLLLSINVFLIVQSLTTWLLTL
jgi:hypothetical protein